MSWITFTILSILLWGVVGLYLYFGSPMRKPSQRELRRDQEHNERYLALINSHKDDKHG
jgi:predicted LPLAT superfamily acyltransferase